VPRLVATSGAAWHDPGGDAGGLPAAQRRAARVQAGSLESNAPPAHRAAYDAHAASVAAGSHVPLALALDLAREDG
jgi:hypothetical protein